MSEIDFGLVLPFDTDNPEFARGFEAGRIWAALRHDDGPMNVTAHAINAEMLIRMAEADNRTVIAGEVADGWVAVDYGARDDC